MVRSLSRRAVLASPLGLAAGAALGANPGASVAGVVEAVQGPVRRSGLGGGDRLGLSDSVFRGDRSAADCGARAAVRMADGSALAVGSGAEIAIDDFVYEPQESAVSLIASVKVGAFRYVSGQIAKIR